MTYSQKASANTVIKNRGAIQRAEKIKADMNDDYITKVANEKITELTALNKELMRINFITEQDLDRLS